MSEKGSTSGSRTASSTRLTVLLLFLVVVGAGCIYEFAFARPGFQKAWDKIREVDESSSSSEYTSEKIDELMGRKPFQIDESQHDECVVHTYRWRSGLLVKNHDIHVVFTKFSDAMIEKLPELENTFHYYSASAGQSLDLKTNFPLEKKTIVENLNPPAIGMSGGGGHSQGGGGDEKEDDGADIKEDAGADIKEDAGADKKEDDGA